MHALLALPEPLEDSAPQQAARTYRLEFGLTVTEAKDAGGLAERAQALPAVAPALCLVRSGELVPA